jgi:hypothetical protein
MHARRRLGRGQVGVRRELEDGRREERRDGRHLCVGVGVGMCVGVCVCVRARARECE